MTITVEDRLELHELSGRYADIIDSREWERLSEIFTEDGVFELRAMDGAMVDGLSGLKWEGLSAIVEYMAAGEHPAAHLMKNIYVDEVGSSVRLSSRGIFPFPVTEEGQMGSSVVTGSYWDRVVKSDQGWRIAHRVFSTNRIEVTWD
jgi:3-phenylpropionate/cinnamic acid dioxygenase small subunit